MQLKVLIIDDHPAMIEGYKSILSFNPSEFEINFTTALNCESAYKILTTAKENAFDLILLDVILPAFEAREIASGEDLGLLAKRCFPSAKLIMLTSHTEAFVLYGIVKKVNPEGLLVKSDFTPEEFLDAFNKIVNGATYYSISVGQGIKEMLKNTYLDTYNRQIISLLSQGIKTKNLPHHLNLSISAVDKRKVQIKEFFGIEKGTDEDIIREAKKRGFV
jgi:DNA-binding NarL/FixJ family response regulator